MKITDLTIQGAVTGRLNSGENIKTPEQIFGPKSERKITILNRAAVKRYALAVSKAKRAGKFTRVGESFFIGCEAELEHALRRNVPTQTNEKVSTEGLKFTTKLTREKAVESLELLAAGIISGKVMRHPSLGQTLKD